MSSGDNIVSIIKNANGERGSFDIKSVASSLIFSLGVSVILLFLFSALRPRNNVVYAPKVKYADEKHQPPKLDKTPWAWIRPIVSLNEGYMIEKIGLDAVVFLRFLRLCRLYLGILTVVGCGAIIPLNIIATNKLKADLTSEKTNPLLKLTVSGLYGHWLWPHIVISYVFTIVLLILIYTNYMAVIALRQKYFNSDEYQASLHSRTLMLIDIPAKNRTDADLSRIARGFKNPAPFSQAQMGRDVGKLPLLIEKHNEAVRKLESHLAKYLKDPTKLPSKRPTHKSSNGVVDAIDYYTNRVQSLEQQIETARDAYDALTSKPYGFVSYPSIPIAHQIIKVNKSRRLFLSPRPSDILWSNLTRGVAKRSTNRFFGNVIFVTLCILWTVPNALIATFISNLYNLGSVWPWFQGQLNDHPTFWAVIQGVLGPVLLALFFLILPSIMRRISEWEGSLTRNARERKVFHKLFLFFFINNFLIFTLFGVLWNFVQTTIVDTAQDAKGFNGFWTALKNSKFFDGLADAIVATSSFWILYVSQRNLGCLLDLVQAWDLFLKWFKRTFLAPTPREMIEWSAPQNFDYAVYYNTFLYNFVICISYATLAPLVLPFGLIFFTVSCFTYKYAMLYVCVTKVESGGAFWRVLVNRLLLSAGFSNAILFLVIWVKIGIYTAIAIVPIAGILLVYKVFLVRSLDPQFDYYKVPLAGEPGHLAVVHHNDQKKDRLRSRFGHPSLSQSLIVPMVHERSKHLLREVYKGRLHDDRATEATPAVVTPLLQEKFELVAPEDLNFDHFRNRSDFAEELGDIYDGGDNQSIRTTTTAPGPYPGEYTPPKRREIGRSISGYTLPDRQSPLAMGDTSSDRDGDNSVFGEQESVYELESYQSSPQFRDMDDSMSYASQEDLTNLLRR